MRKLWLVAVLALIGMVTIGAGPEESQVNPPSGEVGWALDPDEFDSTQANEDESGEVEWAFDPVDFGLEPDDDDYLASHWCWGRTWGTNSAHRFSGFSEMSCRGDVVLMGMYVQLYKCTRWLGLFCGRSRYERHLAARSRYGTGRWSVSYITGVLSDGWYRAVTRHTVQGRGWRDAWYTRSKWVNVK